MQRLLNLPLLLMYMCICGMSASEEAPEETPEVEVRFAEIIIKVEPEVIVMPEGSRRAPLSEIEIKSKALKELNRKFNLEAIERLYAKRELEEAEEPDLEEVYLLRFPELNDVDAMIREYQKLEGVIYAEENMVLSIY